MIASSLTAGLGELAQQKAADDAVREFGRRMVDDHGKANRELAPLAASKQVQLTDKPSRKTQGEKDRLSKLSGSAFETLPTLGDHLQMIRQVQGQLARK